MSKDIQVCSLLETYGKLLTEKQFEMSDLYYSCDLSLSEIAEIKNISRQSVSDAINISREELYKFEQILGLNKIKMQLKELAESVDEKTKKRIAEIIEI